MPQWNDTDVPLAFLITFRTFGTWLHGDERGSVDRHNNVYGTPRIPANPNWHKYNSEVQKNPPVLLDAERRKAVEDAIREACRIKEWALYAINIRTNHGHTVVANPGIDPDVILNIFKSNATRKMRETGCWPHDHSPWVVKGSKRRLWNNASIDRAIDYVLYGQGDDLPDFDD